MLPDINIPELPLNEYHRFMTTVGALVTILSLFIDTTFLPGRVVFEMGAATFVFGLIGWLLEIFLGEYSMALNMKWKEVISKSGPRQSPYDLMDSDQVWIAIGSAVARFLVIVGWVYVEWKLFSGTTL